MTPDCDHAGSVTTLITWTSPVEPISAALGGPSNAEHAEDHDFLFFSQAVALPKPTPGPL